MNQTDAAESADRLLRSARWMPNSDAKLQLVERAVRLADAENDEELAFDARLVLTETAAMTLDSNKRIVSFAWCLNRFEQEPDRFARGAYSLMWWFKGVGEDMARFPRISREEIEQVHTRMERIYQQHDYGLRPVYASLLDVALMVGDKPAADSHYEAWKSERKDGMNDCPACETNRALEYLVLREKHKAAFRKAAPNLDGRQQCGSGDTFQRTVVQLLRPLVLDGDDQQADELQQRAHGQLRRPTVNLCQAAVHMAHLTHRDDRVKALRVFERFLPRALDPPAPDQQLRFYLASEVLMRRLATTGRSRKMRLPRSFPLYDESGSYRPAELADWFEAESRQLIQQFDRRNGNDFYSREVPKQYVY
ncbi:MAG: hypothetical protein RIC55_07595 [Pirellulaceae bacterium]